MREVFLVARREYLAYVGAWGFWLSLVTTPLLLAVLIFAPILLREAEPDRRLAIMGPPADVAAVMRAFSSEGSGPARPGAAKYVIVETPMTDPASLSPYLTTTGAQRLFGVLVVAREGRDVALRYYSANLTDRGPIEIARKALRDQMLREALAMRGVSSVDFAAIEKLEPKVLQFDPRAAPTAGAVQAKDRAPFAAALAAGFILWTAVFSIANMLLSGVIEEKSSRVLDTLLTSVSPVQILAGKLLGVASVSLTLFGVWAAAGAGFAQLALLNAPPSALDAVQAVATPQLLAVFLGSFLAGYLMYGAIFLALGSLCESLQEAQTLIGPMILVLMLPVLLFAPAFENPSSPVVQIASWIPLFTPFLTPLRAAAGISPWEAIGLGIVMVAAIVAIMTLAARVFRAGVNGTATAADVRRRLSFKRAAP